MNTLSDHPAGSVFHEGVLYAWRRAYPDETPTVGEYVIVRYSDGQPVKATADVGRRVAQ